MGRRRTSGRNGHMPSTILCPLGAILRGVGVGEIKTSGGFLAQGCTFRGSWGRGEVPNSLAGGLGESEGSQGVGSSPASADGLLPSESPF